jgi:hypothetical protein
VMQSITPTIDDILEQLTRVFQDQVIYFRSEQAFEDLQPWNELVGEWDIWNEKLQMALQKTELLEADRSSIKKLIEEHNQLAQFGKAELSKLGDKINSLNNTKKVLKTYGQYNNNESIFYDKKK